jgi:hypothetical protein
MPAVRPEFPSSQGDLLQPRHGYFQDSPLAFISRDNALEAKRRKSEQALGHLNTPLFKTKTRPGTDCPCNAN